MLSGGIKVTWGQANITHSFPVTDAKGVICSSVRTLHCLIFKREWCCIPVRYWRKHLAYRIKGISCLSCVDGHSLWLRTDLGRTSYFVSLALGTGDRTRCSKHLAELKQSWNYGWSFKETENFFSPLLPFLSYELNLVSCMAASFITKKIPQPLHEQVLFAVRKNKRHKASICALSKLSFSSRQTGMVCEEFCSVLVHAADPELDKWDFLTGIKLVFIFVLQKCIFFVVPISSERPSNIVLPGVEDRSVSGGSDHKIIYGRYKHIVEQNMKLA